MWGALAAGAAAGLASSALGVFGQHESARLQKEFYKKRHQYEVADLRKAGLNPILSATNGASGGLNVPGIDGSGAVNSAIQAYKTARANPLVKSQVDLTNSQSAKTQVEALTSSKLGNVYDAQAESAKQQSNLISEEARQRKRENDFYDANPDVYRAQQREKAVPGLGGKMSVAADVVQGAINSAKPLARRVIKSISPSSHSDARRLYELSGEQ